MPFLANPKFKYEPSAGVLDEMYERLVRVDAVLRRHLSKAINDPNRDNTKLASLYDQVELIESFLEPFLEEEEYWRERWEERRCAAMMRL